MSVIQVNITVGYSNKCSRIQRDNSLFPVTSCDDKVIVDQNVKSTMKLHVLGGNQISCQITGKLHISQSSVSNLHLYLDHEVSMSLIRKQMKTITSIPEINLYTTPMFGVSD
jgi:hypothetical protein